MVGTTEKDPAALELLVSQRELEEREGKEKEKRAQARQRYEEKVPKQKSSKKDEGSAIRRAAKKAAAAMSAGFAPFMWRAPNCSCTLVRAPWCER